MIAMVRFQKAAVLGEILKDAAFLNKYEQASILEAQNKEFLEKVEQSSLEPEQKEKLNDYLSEERLFSKNYQQALKKAGIDREQSDALRPKMYGKIAVEKGYISEDHTELAAALQASDRMELLGKPLGLTRLTLAEQNKPIWRFRGNLVKESTDNFIDSITSDDPKEGFVSENPITKEAQSLMKLSKALYSAIQRGGKSIAELEDVKAAKKAIKNLSLLTKLDIIDALDSEPNATKKRKTRNQLAREVRGKEFADLVPEQRQEVAKTASGRLAQGVQKAFQTLAKTVGKTLKNFSHALYDETIGRIESHRANKKFNVRVRLPNDRGVREESSKALYHGTRVAVNQLHHLHNQYPEKSINASQQENASKWIDRQQNAPSSEQSLAPNM